MKRVFIAHRIAGDVVSNLASMKAWVRWAALRRSVNPIAPYLTLMNGVLVGNIQSERELGLQLSDAWITVCDEFWLCGPTPSNDSHVWRELHIADRAKLRVVDYHDLRLPITY